MSTHVRDYHRGWSLRSPIAAAGLTAVVTAGLLGIGISRAEAASTWYVDRTNPSCSDSGPATALAPLCTIGAGASRATAGQTVMVASGTYNENVTLPTSGQAGAPIVFVAAAGANVTLTGKTHGFTVTGRSWIVVQGFNVVGTSGAGIAVSNSSNVTINANHVSYSGHPAQSQIAQGISLSGTTTSTVSSNMSDHNSEAGILLTNGTTGTLVTGNLTTFNARGYVRAAPGIDVRSPGNTVADNVSHDNEDSGLQFYTGSANNLVIDNVAYGNGDHGIDDLNVQGQRIVGNTVYNNVTAGINLEGTSSGGTLANNISVDNGINSPRTASDIRVDSQSIAGTTLNHDVVFLRPAGKVLFVWGTTSYSSLAPFRAATGQESAGIQADPRWRAPANGDFHLLAGSPAIDSANSGTAGQPATDIEGNPRVDDPAVPDTGVGSRAYDDRGAYELQPSGDAPPHAAVTVTPTSGPAPLTVSVDASASTDTDGSPIASYSFDFGDGSTVGPQTSPTAQHTYSTPTTSTVTVTVTDTAGLTSTATATVTATSSTTTTSTTTTTTTPGSPSNLIGNPGFEVSTAGWNGLGTGVTLTRVNSGHTGNWSAKLTNAGTSSTEVTLNDSPNWVQTTAPGTYTASIWVRADTPGATLKLRLREYQGTTQVGYHTASIILSTSWLLVTLTTSAASPGVSTLDFNAYLSAAPVGSVFYADDASLTRS